MIILLFLFHADLFAKTLVEMKATVDKKEVTVGDPIKYEVEMKIQEGGTIEAPDIKQIGNFEIIEKKEEKEKNSMKFIYTIVTFKTGQARLEEDTISGISFKCKDNKNMGHPAMAVNEWTATADPIIIKIKSVLPPGIQDIKDIKPPVSIPRSLLVVFGSILLFLALAGSGWWLIHRKNALSKLTIEALSKPPHIIAYERLEALKLAEGRHTCPLHQGRIKEYYIELSDIIRRYIATRYEISAPTETTFELYKELKLVPKAFGIEYDKIELIRDFLVECDMVKFAKYIPAVGSIEKDKNRAKDIIDKTKQELRIQH